MAVQVRTELSNLQSKSTSKRLKKKDRSKSNKDGKQQTGNNLQGDHVTSADDVELLEMLDTKVPQVNR